MPALPIEGYDTTREDGVTRIRPVYAAPLPVEAVSSQEYAIPQEPPALPVELPVAQPSGILADADRALSGAVRAPFDALDERLFGKSGKKGTYREAIQKFFKTGPSDEVKTGVNRLLGTGGEERYKTWPEKLVVDAITAPGNVLKSETPVTTEELIKPALDVSNLAGTGGLAGAGSGAGVALGSGPIKQTKQLLNDLAIQAKDHFGITKDAREAGYVLSDGTMLDLTGRHYSGGYTKNSEGLWQTPAGQKDYLAGQRNVDHRELDFYDKGGTDGMREFMNTAQAIRNQPGVGFDTTVVPTNAQLKTIVSNHNKTYRGEPLQVEISNPLTGENLATKDFAKPNVESVNTWIQQEIKKHPTLFSDNQPSVGIGAVSKSEKPFYSALERSLGSINQNKASGEQWLGMLANKGGVKPDELQWSGIGEFLAGKPSVTKAEIDSFLKDNPFGVQEVIKGADTPTKYHDYQLPGGPLSRDTEILTNLGWKRIDEVAVGDIIMTRKDEGDILEWQPVLAAPKVYAENLYHFFSQSIDMRTTENHQMVVKKRRRNKKGIFRTTARELWKMSEMVIPLTGVWTGKGSETICGYNANDAAEFIGWFLAEGSVKQKNGVKNTIQISQCKGHNPEKCDRLEALFNRMNLSWKYYGDAYGIGIKTMTPDLKKLLHAQPNSDAKFIPELFFNESKSVIQSLLTGLLLGDGCIGKQPKRFNKVSYFTNSKRLAGDVQALVLMTGQRASVRQRPSGLYVVNINRKEWCSVDDAKHEITPYNDFAYCVTVENHSIYVRRNGVAAFTGNTNYREVLMTLPKSEAGLTAKPDGNKGAWNVYDKSGNKIAENLNPSMSEREAISFSTKHNNNQYKSSHWDEPNILAHMRMNDRTIDGKKSLHLEEIQSDWHQAGRKSGYKQDNKNKLSVKNEGGIWRVRDEKGERVDLDGSVGFGTEELARAAIARNTRDIGGVPDAPFKKNWHELALKRAIREAAENGYERLSWTPGEAQAARYDLSKHLDNIGYQKRGNVYNITARDKNDKTVWNNQSASLDDIERHLGKEMAEKIAKGDGDKQGDFTFLLDQDLKIGGEGMKGFYDNIVPKTIEKLGKQFGVKVQTGKSGKDTIYYIDIPPAMRDKVLAEGFPLFSANVPVIDNDQTR